MKVIHGLKNLEKLDKRSAVTIGVFDGVHIGHQQIIKKVVKEAKDNNLYSVVVTFDPHPLDVLKPKSYPTILTGLKLKLHLIEHLGVDITLVIKFDKSFAKMSADNFVKGVLVDKLQASYICVGEDFRFGAGSKGDARFLEKEGQTYGFNVEAVPLLKTDDSRISSTRIRNLLKEGKLSEVKSILGHRPIISGQVVAGKGYGRLTGFHTANIETADKASVPKEGVYAGFVHLNNNKKMPAVLNIGPSPTFAVTKNRIEVHILGYDKPLYNKELEIELVARIRDIKKFPTSADLSKQIKQDIQKTKKILKYSFY